MSRLSLAIGVASCAWTLVAAEAPQTVPEETGTMTRLFNGTDLTGWDGDPRLWSVKDGAIRGETTPQNAANGNTFLICTSCAPKDFELRFTFRCSVTNNSGVQYRSTRFASKPTDQNRWRVKGYQHEIRNANKLPNVAGFIYDEGGKRARVCLAGEKAVWQDGKKQVERTLIDQAGFEALFKLNQWNDVVIVARGNHIQHFMNGRLILDFTDNDPVLALKEGIFALQLHAGQPMWTEFKDIRYKDLK
jgi:hypothetical protein